MGNKKDLALNFLIYALKSACRSTYAVYMQ